MYGVELYAAVRLAVVDEGLSHHEAGRRFGIDRRTVKKMLSYGSGLALLNGPMSALKMGAPLAFGERLVICSGLRRSRCP